MLIVQGRNLPAARVTIKSFPSQKIVRVCGQQSSFASVSKKEISGSWNAGQNELAGVEKSGQS